MAQQSPQVEEWVMPEWVEKTIQYVSTELNWVDLVAFGIGIFIIVFVFYFVFRKKKRVHVEEVVTLCEIYENDIQEIKRGHLEEIEKAEQSIRTFKEKLGVIETEFQESLKKKETSYSKRVQKMEKGHTEIRSTDEMTIYELQLEVARLRKKQLAEVDIFENEIEKLKGEIKNSHEGHAKQIELAELEINDLRKQMRALMYRV